VVVGLAVIIGALRGPSSETWTVIYGVPWLILGVVLLFSRANPKAN
jgi:hypothetical protein